MPAQPGQTAPGPALAQPGQRIPGTPLPLPPGKLPPPPAGPIKAIKKAIRKRKAKARSDAFTLLLVIAAVYYLRRDGRR